MRGANVATIADLALESSPEELAMLDSLSSEDRAWLKTQLAEGTRIALLRAGLRLTRELKTKPLVQLPTANPPLSWWVSCAA